MKEVSREEVQKNLYPKVSIMDDCGKAEIRINGEKVPGVFSYRVSHEVGEELPTVELKMLADIVTFDSRVIPELPKPYQPYYRQRDFSEAERIEAQNQR